MDSEHQAAGEKRVREYLIDPLKRRGLAKPTSLTRGEFALMVDDLCRRLAYMTPANLAALEEQAACNPGGKERDRFPIANAILEWAAQIQPPGDDASPLIRAVFAHGLGQDAIAEGWAPELLAEVRHSRRWPNSFVISSLRDRAAEPSRAMTLIEERRHRGQDISPSEAEFIARRRAILDRCRRIGELSKETAA